LPDPVMFLIDKTRNMQDVDGKRDFEKLIPQLPPITIERNLFHTGRK